MAVRQAINLLFNRKTTKFLKRQTDQVLLELDAAISEIHEYTTEVTSYPVEDGMPVTDHARPNPEKLSLNGFITNAPVKWLGGLRRYLTEKEEGTAKLQSALNILMSFAGYSDTETEAGRFNYSLREPVIVDIITGLRVYTDMVMTNLHIPRDATTGEALRFSAEFVKLRRVRSATAPITHTVEKSGGGEGVGKQAPPKAELGQEQPKEIDDRTILRRGIDSFGEKIKKSKEFDFSSPVPEA